MENPDLSGVQSVCVNRFYPNDWNNSVQSGVFANERRDKRSLWIIRKLQTGGLLLELHSADLKNHVLSHASLLPISKGVTF